MNINIDKGVLYESARDNFITPYLDLLKKHGIEVSVGIFKSYMLRKLNLEAGINNLSLSSNYYLAGAVRYYFSGELTNGTIGALNETTESFTAKASRNGEANLPQSQKNTTDNWNRNNCQMLNAIILEFRNAYIDSIGTKFVEPEDFGTMPILQLFEKYKDLLSQINISNSSSSKDSLVRIGQASTNYTYEIIYNFEDCLKYKEPTAPGAWCISYSRSNYDGYINQNNIHYVIFRRNDWKNTERVVGEGYPCDSYGSSLIAVLQKNNSGKIDYITSRWNHGGFDSPNCEADHAFTEEQFYQITGMSSEKMREIFEEWQIGAQQIDGDEIDAQKIKDVTRILKYAQMKALSEGDLPNEVQVNSTLAGGGKIGKSILELKVNTSDGYSFYVLMDKGKVIFDTLISDGKYKLFANASDIPMFSNAGFQNCIILKTSSWDSIYNIKSHKLLEIDGIKRFKNILEEPNYSPLVGLYYNIENDEGEHCLVSFKDNQPLVLPNGSHFYGYLNYNGSQRLIEQGKKVVLEFRVSHDFDSEEYFYYDMSEKKFFTLLNDGSVGFQLNNDFCAPHMFSLWLYSRQKGSYYIVLDDNHKLISFENTYDSFSTISYIDNNLVAFRPIENGDDTSFLLADVYTKHLLKDPIAKSPLKITTQYYRTLSSNWTLILTSSGYLIYDSSHHDFVQNPISSSYYFNVINYDIESILFNAKDARYIMAIGTPQKISKIQQLYERHELFSINDLKKYLEENNAKHKE